MSGLVELVNGRSARIQRVLPGMLAPFEQARDACRERLGATEIEVHLLDAPDECIPEWGIGGSTYGPHTIVLAVDPDHGIDASNVYSTLVHEIHHAIRWRGPGCGTSLGERLVSEGLAQIFEAECTGRVPMYAQGKVTPEDRALAVAALDEDPADEGRWFFGTADLPRWFGYRLGYSIVKHSPAAQQHDAAQLVREPAARFLRDIQP
jgi:uncharacterized protein YjaZ